jgi:hypothetical protein
MSTCHGVQKDGMVLILSLELLLSGDHLRSTTSCQTAVLGER